MRGLILTSFLLSFTACISTPPERVAWRQAELMVLEEGTPEEFRLEGRELKQYLRDYATQHDVVYKPLTDSRNGYMLIGGIKYHITAASETDSGRAVIMINCGSSPIHLRK